MAFRSVPSGLTDEGMIRLPSLSVLIPALLDSGEGSDGILAIAEARIWFWRIGSNNKA